MQANDDTTFKWNWMMGWCMSRRLAPADNTVWKMAEEAYQKVYGTTNVKD